MLFAIFLLIFLALWSLLYVALPLFRHPIAFVANRITRYAIVEKHVSRLRAYGPIVLIVAIGAAITAWAGDSFIDLAEALHAKAPRLSEFDTLAHAWAAAHRSTGSTTFFITMTTAGGPLGLAILGLIVGGVLAIRRRWRWLVYLAITCGGGALLNLELKHYFARARPALAEALRQAHGYSFPSGHAMGSTIVFGSLAYLATRVLTRWRWKSAAIALACTLVISVALSRVYLGVHWISDIGAGISAGMLWVAVTTVAYEVLRRARALRAKERGRPRPHSAGVPPGE
ncbi:MAG TPA: phosphatase PAP2 family protein [Thermoanaerobaculia bacterium]|nr:phosphatase PAP2 family protein [Thermoanaerobaculia bacterium]